MQAHDRIVAGIRCREVLEDLSDYVDRDLPQEKVRQIESHLQGCDWCERFGGQFADAVRTLRQQLGAVRPVPDTIKERLRARLRRHVLSDRSRR